MPRRWHYFVSCQCRLYIEKKRHSGSVRLKCLPTVSVPFRSTQDAVTLYVITGFRSFRFAFDDFRREFSLGRHPMHLFVYLCFLFRSANVPSLRIVFPYSPWRPLCGGASNFGPFHEGSPSRLPVVQRGFVLVIPRDTTPIRSLIRCC